jgi:hypothetical protein
LPYLLKNTNLVKTNATASAPSTGNVSYIGRRPQLSPSSSLYGLRRGLSSRQTRVTQEELLEKKRASALVLHWCRRTTARRYLSGVCLHIPATHLRSREKNCSKIHRPDSL